MKIVMIGRFDDYHSVGRPTVYKEGPVMKPAVKA